MNQTNNTEISAREIKEGMTKGEWRIFPYTNSRRYISIHGIIPFEKTEDGKDEDLFAACTAVNSTYGKNLDPAKYEEVVNALSSCLAFIEELENHGINNWSGYAEAKAALSTAHINSL